MTTWVTSDLHLNHTRILQYNPDTRGKFADESAMTEWIIENWNNTVAPDDEVWILGDVSMGHRALMHGNISRLAGKKRLVLGNHDVHIAGNEELQSNFDSIDKYKEITIKIGDKKHRVILNHYPILFWNGRDQGTVHLYGHCHGNPTGLEPYRAKDIGMDTNNMQLYVLEDVITELLTHQIGDDRHTNERE